MLLFIVIKSLFIIDSIKSISPVNKLVIKNNTSVLLAKILILQNPNEMNIDNRVIISLTTRLNKKFTSGNNIVKEEIPPNKAPKIIREIL